MATYAFSDVHGHKAPLDRLLERVSPSDSDSIFMLGDMIDRGPDPVGVMQLCRDLPGATVLMGNHEDLMLDFFRDPRDDMASYNWEINGSQTTVRGLSELGDAGMTDLVEWVAQLPVCAHARVGERAYVFAHAGIRSSSVKPRDSWDDESIEQMLGSQLVDDLIWIREEFWGRSTGLVDKDGKGPIVVAGHTPTAYLDDMADRPDRPGVGEDGLCRVVRVGACDQTGGVADRWDIDCGAAGGHGFGQVGMVRLDDGAEFYEPIGEGE